jgi:hypothetical protein
MTGRRAASPYLTAGKSGTQQLNNSTRDAPDIRPDNPAFFYIRYPAGYQIGQPDIR